MQVDYASATASAVARADTESLRAIFDRYASVSNSEGRFMTSEDFVRKYLGLYPADDYNKESVAIVAGEHCEFSSAEYDQWRM